MNAREERIYLKLGGEYREFGRNGRARTYIFRNMSRLEGYVLRDAEVMMMDADATSSPGWLRLCQEIFQLCAKSMPRNTN